MKNQTNLPNNVEQLKLLIVQLSQQLQEKNEALQEKEQKINSLQYQLKSALEFRFGKSLSND